MRIFHATAVLSVCLLGAQVSGQDGCPPEFVTGPDGWTAAIGYTLDVNERHLILGDGAALSLCPGGSPFSCQAGAIYAFEPDADGWRPTQTIVPADIQFFDGFGGVVALDPLDPSRMVTVSAARFVGDKRGYGHVYEFDGDSWNEAARFDPPDESFQGFFGFDLAVLGDTVLVSQVPYVYRYREIGGQWIHQQTLEQPPELSEVSSFGVTGVTLGESWAFVGAYRDLSLGTPTPPDVPLHGSVIAYRRQPDGSLEFAQRLLPPATPAGGMPIAFFGVDVAFDGRTLVVGASAASPEYQYQGVAHLFELEGGRWVHRQELRSSMAAERDWFGGGILLDGDALVIGHDNRGGILGRSHLFRRGTDGVWREVAIISPGDVAPTIPTGFGSKAALSGSTAVFGASGQDPDGAAYSFDLSCFECAPDLDLDGSLTIFDFLTFLNLFQDGDALADFDGDGELTIFDFLAFQTAFDAGC